MRCVWSLEKLAAESVGVYAAMFVWIRSLAALRFAVLMLLSVRLFYSGRFNVFFPRLLGCS